LYQDLRYFYDRIKADFPIFRFIGEKMSTTTIQIRKKGTITLPIKFRRKYNLDEGNVLHLTDLGQGDFVLSPRLSHVDELADEIAYRLRDKGETLESMLRTLREVREEYAAEHA